MVDRIVQCRRLQRAVLDGTWKPKPVHPFTIIERGKVRKVMPVDFGDRVVERCLCDFVLVPFIIAHIIKDSSACIKGRGLDYAIRRLKAYLEKAPPGAWVIQFDFHDYFHSIDRKRLIAMLRKDLPELFVRLVVLAIGGEDGKGLELGSHVCQLLAVWYPTPLDHLIEGLPGFIGYHRYMDDGIAIFETREEALSALRTFKKAAEDMGLSMNPHKTFCNRATHPIVFCKTRLTKRAGRVKVNVRKQMSRRSVRHYLRVLKVSEERGIDMSCVRASIIGYLNHGDADLTRLVEPV